MSNDHASDTDRFYALLEQLAARIGGTRPLAGCTPRDISTKIKVKQLRQALEPALARAEAAELDAVKAEVFRQLEWDGAPRFAPTQVKHPTARATPPASRPNLPIPTTPGAPTPVAG